MIVKRAQLCGEAMRTATTVSISKRKSRQRCSSSGDKRVVVGTKPCGFARQDTGGQMARKRAIGPLGVRTFLVAVDLSIDDCREAKGAIWAGRSPLLGSIAVCRPRSGMMLMAPEPPSEMSCTGPLPVVWLRCHANLRDPRIITSPAPTHQLAPHSTRFLAW